MWNVWVKLNNLRSWMPSSTHFQGIEGLDLSYKSLMFVVLLRQGCLSCGSTVKNCFWYAKKSWKKQEGMSTDTWCCTVVLGLNTKLAQPRLFTAGVCWMVDIPIPVDLVAWGLMNDLDLEFLHSKWIKTASVSPWIKTIIAWDVEFRYPPLTYGDRGWSLHGPPVALLVGRCSIEPVSAESWGCIRRA